MQNSSAPKLSPKLLSANRYLLPNLKPRYLFQKILFPGKIVCSSKAASSYPGEEVLSQNIWCKWSRNCGIFLTVSLIAIVPLSLLSQRAVSQLTLSQPNQLSQLNSDFKVLFVDSTAGDDSNGNGTEKLPFQTITQALKVAEPNTVILLSPGVYSSETGETFPLVMKSGVTVQGNPRTRGQDIIIQGGGKFKSPTAQSQNVAILGADRASLTGVTVTNPHRRGYGLWIESSSPLVVDNTFTENRQGGIAVKGESAPIIRSNYFYDNGGNGITVEGTLQLEMGQNVFADNGVGTPFAQRNSPQLIEKNQPSAVEETIVEDNQPSVRNNQGSEILEQNELGSSPPVISNQEIAEPEDNNLSNSISSNSNAQDSETTIVEFGEQLGQRTENSPSQESSFELETPPSENELQSTEQESSPAKLEPSIVEESVVEANSNSQPDTSSEQISVPEIATPAESNSEPSQEDAQETSTQIEARSPQPSTIEPLENSISAASFPVPSQLNNQTSASEVTVSSKPTEPSQPESDFSSEVPTSTNASRQNREKPNNQRVDSVPVLSSNNLQTNTRAGQIATVQEQRYRVLVKAASTSQQDLVRSLVPDAFRVFVNGQAMMQAGIFSTLDRADKMRELLDSNGLSVTIEPFN
ncbi:MAG: DUF1565 domain-containing protein [Coleofasciculaceae cyanobacterium]